VNGQQCNPVLFRKALFPEIMKIDGDRGAKSLLRNREITWVDWPDQRLILDIDSIENYLEALRLRTD
jgi:molybdenum cofactor cytidylyltransferase